ncbi:ABC transporter permease [Leptolyngbya sp. FACHB-36]|uniref:ABC transporter permease n=1 Tax=Leptolyngbya sp. FACHB-36 TaxID=2692808 RepID=UPI001681594D|nr:ABC transporter permease [Leptolyngbya sp. FACHB-36]MBD2020106.1 ABC transporter permease [Leptolyngbya sp. FACHB-36]
MVRYSQWRKTAEAIAIPIAALLFSLVLFGAFCAAAGANPFAVYGAIYKAAFGSWFSFQNTLIRAAPLMLTSLCTALPARLGLMIIGNEGALVIGGIGAVIAGLTVGPTAPPVVTQIAMAIAGIVAGGVWIAIVGALRHYRAVNETISSLLMNYIAIALLNHLVGGPMKDPSSLNKPSSYPIPDVAKLGSLPFTRIHYGLIYGLIACAIAYFLIQKTTFGFAARTAGGNVKAARIAGLPVGKLTIIICFLAGSCAGLAGMVEVAAVHSRANESLVAGYGYAGILVAFVARYNPLAASLVAILLGGILASGGALQRTLNLPDATVLVFQGLVFLVVLFSDSLYGRLSLFKEPEPKSDPPASSTAVPI